ncbi:hypothetical protein FLLO111716_07000 [Flavobacterium longum]|uniref:beta strand repeat-containing protein n=1 Tax=Flavobacterium longum TaxID=1299340 RepID=UPI0039E9FB85
MKTKLLFALLLFTSMMTAQVGVNTTAPNSQLDIRSSNQATPANTDGVLIPKVDTFPATNPTAAQQGMLVYLTTAVGPKTPGFYYWDNPTLTWIGLNSSANPDADWYEVATTTAPDNINDDMFHMGRVAIGKTFASYPFEVENSNYMYNIYNVNNNNTVSPLKVTLYNSLTGNADGDHMGVANQISGSGNGAHYGSWNSLSGIGNGNHFGASTYLSGTGNGGMWGTYNDISNSGSGTHYGTHNWLNGSGTGNHYGTFSSMDGTGNGNQVGSYVGITNTGNGLHYGHASFMVGTGGGVNVGTQNSIFDVGNGAHYGVRNQLYGSGSGDHIGIENEMSNTGTGIHTGVQNIMSSTNNNTRRGVVNQFTGSNTGVSYGVFNQMGNAGTGNLIGSGTFIASSGSGDNYGDYVSITSIANNTHYGYYSSLTGIGTGQKYGFYSSIPSATGGTHYGVYSNVLKAGSFAGYFLGNLAIGTTTLNTYIMPPSRGTNGQIMQTDGLGNVTWQNPASVVNAWLVNGNAGTSVATNFLGTTDNVSMAFRTFNLERMRITNGGQVVVNSAAPFAGDVFSAYASGGNYAVNGYSTGSGSAGYFYSSSTGSAVAGYVNGTNGNAGDFWTATGANPASTVDIYNQSGTAPAVAVRTDLANAGADGIELDINGAAAKRGIDMYIDTAVTGLGLAIFHDGTARVANFQQQNAANTQAAVFASSVGSNRTINAQNATTTNAQQTGFFSQGSTGLVTGTYGNAASVWGQSSGIRSGLFFAAGASANTTCLQGSYSGAAGNYDGVGVYGIFTPNPLYGYGVLGQGNWYGLYAIGDSGATGVKTFQIDHPLDPQNKYLRHYSMESPEVLNMYRGNVNLDANGEAVVTLPAYFDEININFSYHLTPIGAQASLFVKEEIQGNQFKIAGGQPNQKISWQVFAERNDLYIQNNPVKKMPEIDKKPEDKGLYLQPELYNQPESRSIFARYKADPSKVKPESEATPEQTPSTKKRELKRETEPAEATK